MHLKNIHWCNIILANIQSLKKSRDLDTKFLEEWEEFTESVVYGSNERER